MRLTSPSFAPDGEIPRVHTCQGDDVSPPLLIEDVPPGTASLALIVDDPDAPDPAAPKRVWVHWVVYGIPPDTARIEQGTPPAGARIGKNDWGKNAWGGPCPPIGRHRYFFELYALDVALTDLPDADKKRLLAAMEGHVLGQAELVGTYQK